MRGRGNSRQQPKPPTFPAAMNALLPSVNSNPTCAPSTPALQRRLHRREAKQRNVAPLWVLGDTTFFSCCTRRGRTHSGLPVRRTNDLRAVPRRRFACPRPNVPCAARYHNHNKPLVAHNTSSFSLSLSPVCFEFPFLLCVQMKERSVGQDSVASGAPWMTRQHASIGVTSTRTPRALCCVRVERSWVLCVCVRVSVFACKVRIFGTFPHPRAHCIARTERAPTTGRYTQKQTAQC